MLRYLNAWLFYPIAERYQGRDIRAKAEVLRQQMRWPWPQRRAWAHAQLAEQLERAGEDVPYYRDLFRRIRFEPQCIRRDVGYLQDLPYLTKQILREQGR